jgi:hypothetical protein
LFVTAVLLSGCKKDNSAEAQAETTVKESPKTNVQKTPEVRKHDDDQARLERIATALNRASGNTHSIIFGIDDGTVGPLVAVDYALFDCISDNGVAVMIAEAMAQKVQLPRPQTMPNRLSIGVQISEVLAADETAGRYVARAGFGSEGFAEWLGVRSLSVAGPREPDVAESMRTKAFMRGFLTEGSK